MNMNTTQHSINLYSMHAQIWKMFRISFHGILESIWWIIIGSYLFLLLFYLTLSQSIPPPFFSKTLTIPSGCRIYNFSFRRGVFFKCIFEFCLLYTTNFIDFSMNATLFYPQFYFRFYFPLDSIWMHCIPIQKWRA